MTEIERLSESIAWIDSTANKQTTRWFLIEIHRRYQLDNVESLVDDADYLGSVLAEDGFDFKLFNMEIEMPSKIYFKK